MGLPVSQIPKNASLPVRSPPAPRLIYTHHPSPAHTHSSAKEMKGEGRPVVVVMVVVMVVVEVVGTVHKKRNKERLLYIRLN